MKKIKFEKKKIFNSNGQQSKTKQFIPILIHLTHTPARERKQNLRIENFPWHLAQCHFDFGMADLGNMTLELCGGAAREMKSIEKTHRGEKNRGVLFRTRASAFD